MQLISKDKIDLRRWDELVASSPGATVYNQSVYLDALAEDWCALVVGDYEGGMAVPFTRRAGISGIYTPNFIRSVSWLGKSVDFSQVEHLLRSSFRRCELRLDVPLFSGQDQNWKYQHLPIGTALHLSSQAKRSLKKFQKAGFELRAAALPEALHVITEELKAKVDALRPIDLQRFTSLFLDYPKEELMVLGAFRNGELQAAQLFIRWRKALLFIKGGARQQALKDGAMYGLMLQAIEWAKSHDLEVSFEGSNVESVRNFYCAFGATDVHYYEWKWNRAPWWFNWMLRLKGRSQG